MKTESDSSKSRGDTQYPKTPKSDSTPDWDLYGATPKFIAAGLRLRPELVLAYLSSTLGGLAGAFARMTGFLGERHHPALSLVLAELHPSKARSLHQLAIEPALHFSDWERRKSQALSPEWFEQHHTHQGAKVRQSNLTLLDELDRDFNNQNVVASERSDLLRHRQNYQPSIILTSPEPKTFDELRGSVFDEHPLIIDSGGRLIRNVVQPHPKQKDWQALLERIVEGARGGIDQLVGESSPTTLDRARRVRTPFLLHLPYELSGQALLHPGTTIMFEVGMLLPTEGIDGNLIPTEKNYQSARNVVGKYRARVNEVLWSRMDNSGVSFAMSKPIPELIEGQDEIHDRIDSLPSALRRSCGGLVDLPLRLLWTALLLDDPKAENVPAFVPGVLLAARWCVENQIKLVTEALGAEQRREMEEAAWVMLRKLGEIPNLPCRFSDVARKYRFQRKDLLEPVLKFLSEERLTSWDPEQNRIDLLECDSPPEWLIARKPGNLSALTLPSRSLRAP